MCPLVGTEGRGGQGDHAPGWIGAVGRAVGDSGCCRLCRPDAMPLWAALQKQVETIALRCLNGNHRVNPDGPYFKGHLVSSEVEEHVVDFIPCDREYTDREGPATTAKIHGTSGYS